MKEIGKAILGIVGLAALITWRAYVLSVLWAWFVVSTFGLPLLSVPVAAGILLILAFAVNKMPKKNLYDEKTTVAEQVGFMVLTPAVVLGIGWIVKAFM